jgi:hypothetical protein
MTDVVAFDIETSGLSSENDLVTVASTYDGKSSQSFLFVCLDEITRELRYRDDVASVIEEFCTMLDNAKYLAAFNGVRFDIPFVTRSFNLQHSRAASWVLKTYDPFEICKSVHSRTFGLNMLLTLNGVESKSGSGMHAVEQAINGDFDSLADYCNDDARLTWNVCSMSQLRLPEGFMWRKHNAGLLCGDRAILHLRTVKHSDGGFDCFQFVRQVNASTSKPTQN